ncbi:MAG: hypothetical protein IT381_10125 [Deltaproteobacteria bacterium]|nr:hypothetical protein [Deltaproteobacteria bacterium]
MRTFVFSFLLVACAAPQEKPPPAGPATAEPTPQSETPTTTDATLVLAAGNVPGPFSLKNGDVLEGAGADATCITAPTDGPAIVVPVGAHVKLRKLGVCAAAGQHAVLIKGSLDAREVYVTGGRVGFRVEDGGALTLTDALGEDIEGLVSVINGSATVTRAVAKRIKNSGFFVATGSFTGEDLESEGGEYGFGTRPEAKVTLKNARFISGIFGGLALSGGGGDYTDITVDGRGKGGEGVISNDLKSPLTFTNLKIKGVRGNGISLIRANATFTALTLEGVATDPDGTRGIGLYTQESTVLVAKSQINAAKGEGVTAIDGDVTLEDTTIDRAVASGATAWHGGNIRLVRSTVKNGIGPALLAIEGGKIIAESGSVQAAGTAAMADCSAGSAITIKQAVTVTGKVDACVVRE